jgi:hypothetical protein
MFALIFTCLYTSGDWVGFRTMGEPIRLDKIQVFGQANIYHLFAAFLFIILVLKKLLPGNNGSLLGKNSYLKNIFLSYFFIVNPLIYLFVYINDITLNDLGVAPIVEFFVYLVTVYYIQDIYLKNKTIDQLNRALTIIEIFILGRCLITIVKSFLGFTQDWGSRLRSMVGYENDFADFFILLIIIALTRLLFNNNDTIKHKCLHLISIAAASYVVVASGRRYLWVEYIIALTIILYCHLRFNKLNINNNLINFSFLAIIILSSTLYIGFDKMVDNKYTGRLLTALSIFDKSYESEYGTQQGHIAEIVDGWNNVKKSIFFGYTPFGQELMEREETATWQKGLYIHNAYLSVWIRYGLIGLTLFLLLYLKALQTGYSIFIKFKNSTGLIIITFLICQMLKNIVWPTAITSYNITIIYIFLISIGIKLEQLEKERLNI